MTTSVLASDPAAFRSVLATAEESVLLVMVDSERENDLYAVHAAVEKLRRQGKRLRLVVYGDGGSRLRASADASESGPAVLESWTRPLLPAVLSTVDAVLPLGSASQHLLDEAVRPGGKSPIVLATVEDIQSLAGPEAHPVPAAPRSEGLGPGIEAAGCFVLQNDWGIGDELLLSAVAREIVRTFPVTQLWIRSRFGFAFPSYVRRDLPPADIRRIETIYQNPTLYGPKAHSPFPGHLVQQMLDKVALDTGLKVSARDVRPELELGSVPRREKSSVILHSRPNPRLLSKDWGLERWQELATLLGEAGVRVKQVGGREEPLLTGVEDLRGAPVHELSEVFLRSGAVACVVGFLMHLAEATRTPAVVIYGGREHPAIDGYPDQIHLSSAPLPCRGRWGCHLGPDLECPHGMKCMDGLTPTLIAGEVFSALARAGNR